VARQKTSRAEILTVRLNPIHAEQSRVLEIIKARKQAGYALVDILTSAVLSSEGTDPVVFNHEQQYADSRLAELVSKAIKEALVDVKLKPELIDRGDSNGEISDYALTFGRGFAARVKHSKGE